MIDLRLGDCTAILPTLPDASVDCVIADPPYPCIDRPYGRMTEPEWHTMMRGIVTECRRILKPHGSAVFVLQPNSERVGRMRPWLWEFMVWAGSEWGIVQDAWWANPKMPPTVHCRSEHGLMRPSVKACVWLGDPDCYRSQADVMIPVAESTRSDSRRNDNRLKYHPSGHHVRHQKALARCLESGKATPFNWISLANGTSDDDGSHHGHGAGTPHALCDWWVRYISPPGGVVCDPFMGSGTVGLAALARGRSFVGIERDPGYFATARRRIDAARAATPLLESCS